MFHANVIDDCAPTCPGCTAYKGSGNAAHQATYHGASGSRADDDFGSGMVAMVGSALFGFGAGMRTCMDAAMHCVCCLRKACDRSAEQCC